MAGVLPERLEELRSDRSHGGSWIGAHARSRRSTELAERTRRILASAAGTSRRGGARAGREPAAMGAIAGAVGRVLAAAHHGAPPRAGGVAPPCAGGGARPHRRARSRRGGDRDPAGAVVDRRVCPDPLRFRNRARGGPAYAAGARPLHGLRAVRGGPCVLQSARRQARRRARRRRGRRAGTRPCVALPDRPRTRSSGTAQSATRSARFRLPRRRRVWAFEPSSRAR